MFEFQRPKSRTQNAVTISVHSEQNTAAQAISILRRYNIQDTTCTAHCTHKIRFEDPSPSKFGALYVDVVPSTFISLFVRRFSIKNEVNRSKTLDGGASQIFELKIGHDPFHGQYGTGGRTHVLTKALHTRPCEEKDISDGDNKVPASSTLKPPRPPIFHDRP